MVYELTLRHARAEVILACRSHVCSQAKYKPFAAKPSGDLHSIKLWAIT